MVDPEPCKVIDAVDTPPTLELDISNDPDITPSPANGNPDPPPLDSNVVTLVLNPPEASAKAPVILVAVKLLINAALDPNDPEIPAAVNGLGTFVKLAPLPVNDVAVIFPITVVDPVTFNDPVILANPAIVFNDPESTVNCPAPPIPLC